jgi:hypothetical protein
MSTAGKALGGLGAVYELGRGANEKFGTGAWDNAQDLANKRDVRLAAEADPQLPVRGVQSAMGMADRAVQSARGLMDMMPKTDTTRTENLSMLPMAPEKKVEAAVVAEAAPQVEAGRQRIEAGALKGLQSGEVHVSQLAEGVVQADAQRAGKELTPEEHKSAVTAEIAAMKTMDKSDLSKYVSYALVAGGLLASVFDKSGQAGAAFHDSLNKQLDRNLASGKMAFEQQMARNKDAREDRKVDLTESDVESKIGDRKVRQEQGERSLGQGDKKIGIMEADSRTKAFAANSSAAAARARLGLLGEQLKLQQGEAASKQALRQSKIDNPSGQIKGESLTTKDAQSAVSEWAKGRGQNVKGDSLSALSQQLRNALKDPATKDYSLNEILDTLVEDGYELEEPTFFGNPDIKVKRVKGN